MNTENIKKSVQLFFVFLKIGCFTFGGGWSILAQMEQEFVEKRAMISKKELLDIVSIGRSIPGIMIANISLIFGYQIAGILGGITAVLGVLMPTYTLTLFIAIVFLKIKNNTIFESIMIVIRPICVGMLLAVIFSLSLTNYYSDSYLDLKSVFIGVIVLVLQIKYKVSVPKVILLSGILGIVIL